MGKIVITGASGRYGRMATDGLIARGRAADLILMTRDPAKLADRIAAGCTVRYGDFDRPETLGPAMAGAERLLLISGTRVGARVVQHRAVVDAAATAGLRHIVYTSFVGIDDPTNPAEVRHDHAATEALIRASGLGFTMLRDAHYADAMIVMTGPAMMASGQWISNAGAGREAMVWREDCAACAVAVLAGGDAHIGQTYNITGPELQSFAEVAALMAQVTGHALSYVPVDDGAQYAIFDAMGIPRRRGPSKCPSSTSTAERKPPLGTLGTANTRVNINRHSKANSRWGVSSVEYRGPAISLASRRRRREIRCFVACAHRAGWCRERRCVGSARRANDRYRGI